VNLVIDASVAIKWFVEEETSALAASLLKESELLHAPDFLFVELANIAWKKVLRGDIGIEHAQLIAARAHEPFAALYPAAALHERALEIAIELQHPVYDCVYLACAEAVEDGCLITADRRFYNVVASGRYSPLMKPLSSLAS
jgi:predicted nucleic acid-binding protein